MPFAVRYPAVAVLGFFYLLFASPAVYCQNYAFAPPDPVRTHLLALGKPGQTIEQAREKVLEILEEPNGCADWFAAANPDAANIFAGLPYSLDENGRSYITAMRTDAGAMLYIDPYSGSTRQNAGVHAVITLNIHGPFFSNAAFLMRQDINGSAPRRDGWRPLQIASYPGNTLAAQILTLLHELGHVIGRIPDDSDELRGQSTRNTQDVLHHCRGAIKASTRRSLNLHSWARSAANGAN